MKTIIIDNYDSFTFNLYQIIAEVNGERPLVLRNDQLGWPEVQALAYDNLIISPGPGRPENSHDFGICAEALLKAPTPVLGICLGHQGLGHLFGGAVVHAPEAMHGRLSQVYHSGSALFAGIPQPFMAVRYHSLIVAGELPACLERTAWTRDGLIMGLRHRERPLWGVQFHPESICTEHGHRLLANFRELTAQHGRPNPGRRSWAGCSVNPAGSDPRPGPAPPQGRVCSRRLDGLYHPEQVFGHMFSRRPYAFWLDSSRVEPGLARFSFMGDASGPRGAVVAADAARRTLTITEGAVTRQCAGSIFDYLRRRLGAAPLRSDELPFDFNCGFVGYFGYELGGGPRLGPEHGATAPDACFLFADRVIAFDHQERKTYLVCYAEGPSAAGAEAWFDAVEQQLRGLPPLEEPAGGAHPRPIPLWLARTRARYLDDIRRCQGYIRDGESYELCLTNQIHAELELDGLALYRSLRRVNPAPYAAFLRLGDIAVLCSSPERFLRIGRDGWVESKPIKGTLARGATAAEDAALRRRLAMSPKDRAENLMIVDLVRNDLGRVCEVGSVAVPGLMQVETYATVHQLVSTIRGRLRPGLGPLDCVEAAFPGGSMTGAPKIRTMEILRELEQRARGVYAGSLGFLGLNHTADLNIVIRTIVMAPGELAIGVGGAIVALSDPEAELQESLLKAKALIRAILGAARGESDAALALAEQQLRHRGCAVL